MTSTTSSVPIPTSANPPVAVTPTDQAATMPAGARTDTAGARTDTTPGVSRGSSSTNNKKGKKKKKRKRAKDPKDFELWRNEDKQCYTAVTYALRHWKATRRQCRYIRTPVGHWDAFCSRVKGHPAHAQEMHSYAKALKEWVPVPDEQPFDLPE
ncbi:hypothetical protein QR680_007362 [Steinernema hermaphroditum]|uniref:Uncharacterized protein n=1 Tax=Steinernema hermaphroditum TaxID=289476 RepID=A0AA39IFG4_9BILA|nr:hypothetical protein QR680_007362 [Steinernema hermaphroditum]